MTTIRNWIENPSVNYINRISADTIEKMGSEIGIDSNYAEESLKVLRDEEYSDVDNVQLLAKGHLIISLWTQKYGIDHPLPL